MLLVSMPLSQRTTIRAADGDLPAIAEIEGTDAFDQRGDFLSR